MGCSNSNCVETKTIEENDRKKNNSKKGKEKESQVNKSTNETDKKDEKKENEEKNENEESNKKEEQEKKELNKNSDKNIQNDSEKKEEEEEEEDDSQFKDPKKDLTEDKKNNLDKILENAPKREESTLESLLNYFKTNTNNLSEVEKAWLLYKWLAINIEYNYEGRDNGTAGRSWKVTTGSVTTTYYDYTEEDIFKAGKGVCADYSRLFKKMGEFLNLEIVIINGKGKGEGVLIGEISTGGGHAWNAVKINDNWYLIDTTWARDKNNIKNINYGYFCTNPEIFVMSHFPDDEKWQLLQKPINIEDYTKMVQIRPKFYSLGLKKIFPNSTILNIDQEGHVKISYDKKKKIFLLVTLFRLEGNTYQQQSGCVFVEKFDGYYYISFLIDRRGKYKLTIYGKDDTPGTYPELVSFIIKGTNKNKIKLNYPYVEYYFKEEEFQLIEPRHKDLIKNSKVDFKIKVSSNIENLSIKFGNNRDNELKMDQIEKNIYELKDVLIESNLGIYAYKKDDNYQSQFLEFNAIEKCNLMESIIEKAYINQKKFLELGFTSIDPDVSTIKTNEKGQVKIFFDKSKNLGLSAELGIMEDGIMKYSKKNITLTKLDDHYLIEFKLDKPDDYDLRFSGLCPSSDQYCKNYYVVANISIIPEDN